MTLSDSIYSDRLLLSLFGSTRPSLTLRVRDSVTDKYIVESARLARESKSHLELKRLSLNQPVRVTTSQIESQGLSYSQVHCKVS